MAEFLIRIRNKENDSGVAGAEKPYLDVKLLQRGDVVVVVPDGWAWSSQELTNPDWRIVACPAISVSEAKGFLTPELGDPRVNPMLQPRGFKVNVDAAAIPQDIKNWIADDTRAQPILTINATTVRGLKKAKDPVPDPGVL